MQICLSRASRGEGEVSPNPMVGAVVVRGNRIIGKGYHHRFGGPHAEVYALRGLTGDLRQATLYVNLEPCNYHGKTPPCTELILRSGIRNVVIGMKDPNPRVSGGGVRALRRAGIHVTTGILEDDCRELNRVFIKRMTTGLPYVTLKVAQTLDGYIADTRGTSRWISGEESRRLVHAMRSVHDAILVGAGTVRKDNPRLTARHGEIRSPLRVVIDGNLTSAPTANVYQHQGRFPTIVFCGARAAKRYAARRIALERRGVAVYPFPADRNGKMDLRIVLRLLSKLGIASILVEGGSEMYSQLLNQHLADRLYWFVAPKMLGGGLPAWRRGSSTLLKAARILGMKSIRIIGEDMLIEASLS